MSMTDSNQQCPCHSGQLYHDCCGIYLETNQIAPTPEALMRSRYTAYAKHNINYIVATMRGRAAEGFNATEALSWSQQAEWLGLTVIRSSIQADRGQVEFIARYRWNNQVNQIHEISEFQRTNGIWYYIDGVQPSSKPAQSSKKIGRNETCHCGSGKKYKKCCGR